MQKVPPPKKKYNRKKVNLLNWKQKKNLNNKSKEKTNKQKQLEAIKDTKK